MTASCSTRSALAIVPRRHRNDHEFLAPALQILETPPSPIRMALMSAIGLLVMSTLAWGYLGRIDMVATAQGKIQPVGRVKLVQPLESGVVSRILVANGSHVAAGDPLVTLDSEQIEAEARSAALSLASAQAESTRRTAAAAAARQRPLDTNASIDWAADVPAALRQREDRVMAADLSQLSTALGALEAQREQKRLERDQLDATMVTQERLIATLQERVSMRTDLIRVDAGTKAALIDATETLQYQITQLAMLKGQFVSAESGESVFIQQEDKARDDFLADNAQKLGAAERQSEEQGQSLVKAQARRKNFTLVASIAGTVQASTLTNPGQVLAGGQEVMRIVPDDAVLEAQVYVQNHDIGFIRLGQDATLKLDAFPFTRYGTIKARVVRVASDALPEPDAALAEGDPARSPSSAGLGGAQRTQNLVYSVWLSVDDANMKVDGRKIPLLSGMTVTADLATGRRRIIEYLFSPLAEVSATAMRER